MIGFAKSRRNLSEGKGLHTCRTALLSVINFWATWILASSASCETDPMWQHVKLNHRKSSNYTNRYFLANKTSTFSSRYEEITCSLVFNRCSSSMLGKGVFPAPILYRSSSSLTLANIISERLSLLPSSSTWSLKVLFSSWNSVPRKLAPRKLAFHDLEGSSTQSLAISSISRSRASRFKIPWFWHGGGFVAVDFVGQRAFWSLVPALLSFSAALWCVSAIIIKSISYCKCETRMRMHASSQDSWKWRNEELSFTFNFSFSAVRISSWCRSFSAVTRKATTSACLLWISSSQLLQRNLNEIRKWAREIGVTYYNKSTIVDKY